MAVSLGLGAGCVRDEAPGEQDTAGGLVGSGTGAECVIDDTVKVGAVFSLNGGAAFAGEYQQQGMELAFDELAEAEGVEYEVVLEDDQTDLEQSIAAYEKLIERDEVSVVIGPTLSDMAFSTFEDAQNAGVPVLGVSTTAEGIPEIGDYVFRASLPEEVALAASMPAAKKSPGPSEVAVMHDSADEFTVSAYETYLGTEDAGRDDG